MITARATRVVIVAADTAVTDAAEDLTAQGIGCTEPGTVKTTERVRYLDVTGIRIRPAAATSITLSPRRQQILYLIAEGFTGVEIGKALSLTENTVKVHVRRLLRALGANGRPQAVLIAMRLGLLDRSPL